MKAGYKHGKGKKGAKGKGKTQRSANALADLMAGVGACLPLLANQHKLAICCGRAWALESSAALARGCVHVL